MMNKQFSNVLWNLADSDGNVGTWEKVTIAVLMDIRRELQTLNRLLGCQNFIDVPAILRRIDENTTPTPRKHAKKAKG